MTGSSSKSPKNCSSARKVDWANTVLLRILKRRRINVTWNYLWVQLWINGIAGKKYFHSASRYDLVWSGGQGCDIIHVKFWNQQIGTRFLEQTRKRNHFCETLWEISPGIISFLPRTKSGSNCKLLLLSKNLMIIHFRMAGLGFVRAFWNKIPIQETSNWRTEIWLHTGWEKKNENFISKKRNYSPERIVHELWMEYLVFTYLHFFEIDKKNLWIFHFVVKDNSEKIIDTFSSKSSDLFDKYTFSKWIWNSLRVS